jgi:MYXO-CTERM domain-containing protein
MRFLPLTLLLLPLGAVPATAAASPLPAAPAAAVKANQARFAARGFRGGYRSRPRTAPARRYAPSRYRSRPQLGRRLFRGVLQALGIAFLVNLLFGWGAGGSPLGLILLLGLVLLFVARRRRRPAYAPRG